jgi:hypothetical protein
VDEREREISSQCFSLCVHKQCEKRKGRHRHQPKRKNVFPAINKVDVQCKGSVAGSEDQTPAPFILGAQCLCPA